MRLRRLRYEGITDVFGPGYRVYFGEEADHIVFLLCGGDKATQKQDIETAQRYWKEYKNNG